MQNKAMMVELVTATLQHFPMCEQYAMMAQHVHQTLQDHGLSPQQAAEVMLEAVASGVVGTCDPETLQADEGATLRYLAVFTALLDNIADAGGQQEKAAT